MDQIKIGKYIAKKRKGLEMTQVELAEKLNVTNRTVSRWENGNYMPDLSLIEDLSIILNVSIDELLSGEDNDDIVRDERTLLTDTIHLSNKTVKRKNGLISLLIMLMGVYMMIYSVNPKSLFSSIAIIIIGILTYSRKARNIKVIGLSVLVLTLMNFTIDFVSAINKTAHPKLSIKHESEDVVMYETLFYNYFIIHKGASYEYKVYDGLKEFDLENLPVLPFNTDENSMEKLIEFKSKYVGDTSNTVSLIGNLPLAEFGYVVQIDSKDLGVTINYSATDWYVDRNNYIRQSLVYNTAAIFSLVDNVEYIIYNFSGNSYVVKREDILKVLPGLEKLVSHENLDVELFDRTIISILSDDAYINSIIERAFDVGRKY